MQRFHAQYGVAPEAVPESLGEAEIYRIARQRAGSPLRVRAFFSLAVLGMAISYFWPGSAPDWMFVAVATMALVGIGSYFLYLSRSRCPLRMLHAWMLAYPSRKDAATTRFEWVLAITTIGVFFLTVIGALFRG